MKAQYCKSVLDILYEGHKEWWSIGQVAANYYHMEDDDFQRLPSGVRNDICLQFKTYINKVRMDFDELGEMLLSRKSVRDGVREMLYKRATKEDEAYLVKELRKNKKRGMAAKNRFDKKLSNAKKKKLISKSQIDSIQGLN